MADTSKFKKAHQLANELLAGPDHIVVMTIPAFDMPGSFMAYPVKSMVDQVQGKDVVFIAPDPEALAPDPNAAAPTPEPAPDAKPVNDETGSNS